MCSAWFLCQPMPFWEQLPKSTFEVVLFCTVSSSSRRGNALQMYHGKFHIDPVMTPKLRISSKDAPDSAFLNRPNWSFRNPAKNPLDLAGL